MSKQFNKSYIDSDLPRPATGKQLIAALKTSGLAGLWSDRPDILSSSDFSRKLRKQAWQRQED